MQITDLSLTDLSLFKGLTMREIESLTKQTAAILKTYGKGSRLLTAYEESVSIGVIVSGAAQIITEDLLGNKSVSHELTRSSIIGVMATILPVEYNVASVEAATESIVLWIPYRSLLAAGPKLGRIHGIVMQNLLEAMCLKNIRMMEKIELLSHKSLRERLVIYLLQHEKSGQTDDVPVPGRMQLAKELECNRSALTREIAAMQNDGLLIVGDGTMRLVKDKLKLLN